MLDNRELLVLSYTDSQHTTELQAMIILQTMKPSWCINLHNAVLNALKMQISAQDEAKYTHILVFH
jgi:hypothetical protein